MKPLSVADAAWLTRLHVMCFPHPWSQPSFEELLEKDTVFGWGMEGVAFGLFQKAADEMEVLTIAVLPSYRRQGVARTIMEQALSVSVRKVFLDVAAGNTAAMALYNELGFHPIHTRKAYYASGEDAVVMQKILD